MLPTGWTRGRHEYLDFLDQILMEETEAKQKKVIQGDSYRLRQKKRAGFLGSSKTNHH